MLLETFNDAERFQAATQAWLARDEYRNALAISILATAIRSKTPFRGWILREGERIRMVILQTVPTLLALVGDDREAAVWAAANLEASFTTVTGVAETVQAFAKHRAGSNAVLQHSMTFYVLEKLKPFANPEGGLRLAGPEELHELVALCITAAQEMKLPVIESDPNLVEQRVERAIEEGRQYVWVNSATICAIATYAPALPDCGARIGMVYTPPQFRGRGYGAAITGSISRLLLEGGQRWVCLFADDLNPTSTGVYRRLGFEPNHSAQMWRVA